MILNISSRNGEVTLGKLLSECSNSFQKYLAVKAGTILITTLKYTYSCNPDFQQEIIQEIYDGDFLCDYTHVTCFYPK